MFSEHDVMRTTAALTFVLSAGFLALNVKVALGVLLGGLMSLLTLRLMIIDATKILRLSQRVKLSRRDVSRHSMKSFLKRCALYAATLAAAGISPHLHYMATFCGLLLPRLAIIYHLLQGRIKRGS